MNLSILSHNFGNQQNANYSKVDHSKDSLNRKSFESNPVHSNEPHQTEQKDFKEYLADDEKPLKQADFLTEFFAELESKWCFH